MLLQVGETDIWVTAVSLRWFVPVLPWEEPLESGVNQRVFPGLPAENSLLEPTTQQKISSLGRHLLRQGHGSTYSLPLLNRAECRLGSLYICTGVVLWICSLAQAYYSIF